MDRTDPTIAPAVPIELTALERAPLSEWVLKIRHAADPVAVLSEDWALWNAALERAPSERIRLLNTPFADADGRLTTVLVEAVVAGRAEVVDALVDMGADPNGPSAVWGEAVIAAGAHADVSLFQIVPLIAAARELHRPDVQEATARLRASGADPARSIPVIARHNGDATGWPAIAVALHTLLRHAAVTAAPAAWTAQVLPVLFAWNAPLLPSATAHVFQEQFLIPPDTCNTDDLIAALPVGALRGGPDRVVRSIWLEWSGARATDFTIDRVLQRLPLLRRAGLRTDTNPNATGVFWEMLHTAVMNRLTQVQYPRNALPCAMHQRVAEELSRLATALADAGLPWRTRPFTAPPEEGPSRIIDSLAAWDLWDSARAWAADRERQELQAVAPQETTPAPAPPTRKM